MNAFRAWVSVVLFTSLGVISLIGYEIPREDPGSIRRRLDSLADLQDAIGDINMALIMFGLAVFSWFWFKLR